MTNDINKLYSALTEEGQRLIRHTAQGLLSNKRYRKTNAVFTAKEFDRRVNEVLAMVCGQN